MLGMGLTLSFKDFKDVLKTPVAIGIGVGAQFIIMPILGFSLAKGKMHSAPPLFATGS